MGQIFSSSASAQLGSFESAGSLDPATLSPAPILTVHEFDSVRFEVNDPSFVPYLQEHGYVVIKGVASALEVEQGQAKLWDFLKGYGMLPDQVESWTDSNFLQVGSSRTGILSEKGINQSDFLWHARLLPKVKAAFAAIYKESNLISSFDGGNIFRPWHNRSIPDSEYIQTAHGWFHVDQGRDQRGMQCVQGLVSFKDADAHTGGFCVIPGSHKHHDKLVDGKAGIGRRNFVIVPTDFAVLQHDKILPKLKAGDLLLWDSRTIHCNCPSLVLNDKFTPSACSTEASIQSMSLLSPNELLRIVAYVCMTPAAWASPEVIRTRIKIYGA